MFNWSQQLPHGDKIFRAVAKEGEIYLCYLVSRTALYQPPRSNEAQPVLSGPVFAHESGERARHFCQPGLRGKATDQGVLHTWQQLFREPVVGNHAHVIRAQLERQHELVERLEFPTRVSQLTTECLHLRFDCFQLSLQGCYDLLVVRGIDSLVLVVLQQYRLSYQLV